MKASAIRDAILADSDQLAELVRQLHEERGAALDVQQARDAVCACIGDGSRDLIVADCDNDVVGYVAVHWIPFPMLHGQEAYVSDLLIRRDWRGRGIGRRLLAVTEDRARARGCVRIMLNNRKTAESFARGFFAQAGFRERTEFANFVKPLGNGAR
jgi:ribosomal protein S18 acetylase RimI-like enzyme